jgi:transcriptional regulator SbtR-like protein
VEAARRRNREIAEAVLIDAAPGEAVFEFVRRCIEVPSVWRATVSAPPWGSKRGAGLAQIAPVLAEIVERSKEAGTLRPDVEVTDVVFVLKAVRSIADLCDTAGSKPSLRFLELALDGLRPGHEPLAHPPLGVAQLARLLDPDE